MSNTLLYPAVGGAPGSTITRDPAQAPDRVRGGGNESGSASGAHGTKSFSQILGQTLEKPIHEPLKFSSHASARAHSRKLDLGPEQMRKLNEAVDKAAAKGLDDTLVLTKDAAFIVSVKNRTVVT